MTPDERANNFQKSYYRLERGRIEKKNGFIGWVCTIAIVACLILIGATLLYQVLGERMDKIYQVGGIQK